MDGTFFKRWGKKVAQARWAYDGSAQGGKKIAFGNTWVIAAIVVQLPSCSSPVALPVLFRLWRGKGTSTQVELAAQMLSTLITAFGDRVVHGVGDAAFHGESLIRGTARGRPGYRPTRCCTVPSHPRPASAAGRQERRPAGTPAHIAPRPWQSVTIHVTARSPRRVTLVIVALWYGSFTDAPGRAVLVKEPASGQPYDLGIFTLHPAATTRGSDRAVLLAVAHRALERDGEADHRSRGRLQPGEPAVERTVPFGFLVQSLLIVWYARSGDSTADVTTRRLLCPWYQTKTEPAAADMVARLRREFLKARFSAISQGHNPLYRVQDYAWTCDIPAA